MRLGQNGKFFANRLSKGDESCFVGVGVGDGVSGSFGIGVWDVDGGDCGEAFDKFCVYTNEN